MLPIERETGQNVESLLRIAHERLDELEMRMKTVEDGHDSLSTEIRNLKAIIDRMCSELLQTKSEIVGQIDTMQRLGDVRDRNTQDKIDGIIRSIDKLTPAVQALITQRNNEKNIEQYKRGLLQNIKTAIYFVSVLAACVGAIYTFIHWVEQPKSEIVGK